MPRYFFDTSAFTKIYHPEISNLVVVETQSAFAMKVRTGVLDQAKAEAAMDSVFQDIAGGRVTAIAISECHVDSARALVSKYGYSRRARTLDSLQLAVAVDLHSRDLLDVFVVADRQLGEIALLEGIVVENPEDFP